MKKMITVTENNNNIVNVIANGSNIEFYFKNKPYLNTFVDSGVLLNFIDNCNFDGGEDYVLTRQIKSFDGSKYSFMFSFVPKESVGMNDSKDRLLIHVCNNSDGKIETYFFVDPDKLLNILLTITSNEKM